MESIPYDKRSGKIWFDGKSVNWSDVKIHVLSHGLHYASCVFEGERVYDGEIFRLCFVIFSLFNKPETVIPECLSIKCKALW